MVSLQHWSGSPEKSQSYQANIQCWAIIGPPAKRHLNGFLLAVDDGPFIMIFGSSIPSSTKKTFSNLPPLTKLSGSAHEDSKGSDQTELMPHCCFSHVAANFPLLNGLVYEISVFMVGAFLPACTKYGCTVSHFSYAPLFEGPHFLTKMLESNILYDNLFIDI